jgi:selenide, water dikinase
LFDPQTSGGLLAGVPEAAADACLEELQALGYLTSAVIGTVTSRTDHPEMIVVRR